MIEDLKRLARIFKDSAIEVGCNIYPTHLGIILYGKERSIDIPNDKNAIGSFHTHPTGTHDYFSATDIKSFIEANEDVMYLGYDGVLMEFKKKDLPSTRNINKLISYIYKHVKYYD